MAILDGDARYMENFASYVTLHYRHRFNLYTFTGAETLVEYVRSAGADIVLVGADECGEWISRLESGLLILLSSGAPSADASPEANGGADPTGASHGAFNAGNIERVDRYSGADKLVSDILRIYTRSDRPSMDTDAINGGRENKIIAVFSAEGGSGRTSVAIALCSHFAKLKFRTVYIGLDLLGAGDFAFEGEKDGGLSDIIYTIKTRPDRLGLKLEALGKSAPGHGFYYFSSPLYPMDIDEIQPSDIEVLIARLRGAGLYDRIVIDTCSGLSLKNKALMELIDGIYIIAGASASSYKKLMLFKEQIDKCFSGQASSVYRRCHIIVNGSRITDARFGAAIPPGYAGEFVGGQDLISKTEEIAGAFSAKATAIPFCADICDEYSPELLADMSNSFGAALAEIARRA